MKRLLTLSLAGLLGFAAQGLATGYHFRQNFVVAPVLAPVAYTAPLAVCGAAYSAPVAPLVVPTIAPIQGVVTQQVTQAYTAPVVSAPVVTAPVVPAPVVSTPVVSSYSAPLAVVGNAYGVSRAFVAPVVRERVVVDHSRVNVVVGRQAVVVARRPVLVERKTVIRERVRR